MTQEVHVQFSGSTLIIKWKASPKRMPKGGINTSSGPMAPSRIAVSAGAARSTISAAAPPAGSSESGTSVAASSAKSMDAQLVL